MTKEQAMYEIRARFPYKAIKVEESCWYHPDDNRYYTKYSIWVQGRWCTEGSSLEELINDFQLEFPPRNKILFRRFSL
jgi:hypothetical protein